MPRFVAILALVGLSGCAHDELRTACGISKLKYLDEQIIQQAWDERFPTGTTYEHLRKVLPANNPEGNIFSPRRPWCVEMSTHEPDQLYVISEDNRWLIWWGRSGFEIKVKLRNDRIEKSDVRWFLFAW
jgi:hypothetical protein